MAVVPFLLDAFIVLQVVIIGGSLIWISRATNSEAARAILPTIAALFVIATVVALPQAKGDDGLYGIVLVPFSLIVLAPLAAITLAAAAWYWSRKKIQRLERDARHVEKKPGGS